MTTFSTIALMKICKAPNCKSTIFRIYSGYCIKHHRKWEVYGDPLKGKDIERHGLTKTPEHRAWVHMKRRCYNSNYNRYPQYHEKGIEVCDRWRNSFSAFLSDMGMRPSVLHTLERINNNGGYEPGNCRWALQKDQARNRSNNRNVTIDGTTKTLIEWIELSPLTKNQVCYRLYDLRLPVRKALGI